MTYPHLHKNLTQIEEIRTIQPLSFMSSDLQGLAPLPSAYFAFDPDITLMRENRHGLLQNPFKEYRDAFLIMLRVFYY